MSKGINMNKNLKDLKILSIRVYQVVKLGPTSRSFFTTLGTANNAKVSIEIIEGVGALVKSAKDAVIVPFPNISGIYLDTEDRKEEREERIAELSKPAPAQKASKNRQDPIGAKRL
jgi:hypothetical protein